MNQNHNHTVWLRAVCLLLCLCVTACLATACGDDRPPAADTPEPPAHQGEFLSEYGSLTFTGDGQTVSVKALTALAEASGLPEGEYTATYVFLFHNEQWRYDQAETFRLTVDGRSYSFPNQMSATGEDVIAFRLPNDTTATFIKS